MSKKLILLLFVALVPLVGCQDTQGLLGGKCDVAKACLKTQKDGKCDESCCDKTNDADCTNEPVSPKCDEDVDCSLDAKDGKCPTCCNDLTDLDCPAPPPPVCDPAKACKIASKDGICPKCCDHTTDADCKAPPVACNIGTDCSLTTSNGECAPCCTKENDIDCVPTVKELVANIGAQCTQDDQCGTNGICITEASDSNYVGGYCTAEITDPETQACPDGSVVKRVHNKSLCVKSCTTAASCGRGSDYRCEDSVCVPNLCEASCGDDKTCLVYDVSAKKPNPKAICVSKCDPTHACSGSGEVCAPVFGYRDSYCMTDCASDPTTACSGNADFSCIASPDKSKKICYTEKINAKIQTECELNEDCGPEGKCNAQKVDGLTNYKGACVGNITSGRETCPDGSHKFGSSNDCRKNCTTADVSKLAEECRDAEHYVCQLDACVPDSKECDLTGQCHGAEEECLQVDASGNKYCRVPSTGTKRTGETCKSYAECGGGNRAICRLYDRERQLGYCTKACDENNACGTTWEFCESFNFSGTAKYCLVDCTNDPSVCGNSGKFTCQTSLADPTKRVCKVSSVKKVVEVDNLGGPCTKDSDCGDKDGRCLYPSAEFPNGYCTAIADGKTCPEGSHFKFNLNGSYCLKTCSAVGALNECRDSEGYACVEMSNFDVTPVCFKK